MIKLIRFMVFVPQFHVLDMIQFHFLVVYFPSIFYMPNAILLYVVFFYLLAPGVTANLALCCSCASADIQDTFVCGVSIYIFLVHSTTNLILWLCSELVFT